MSVLQVTTSKRLIHKTLYNVFMRVATAVVSFLLVKFFLTKLGEEKYGIWVLIASIFAHRGMLSMGLNSAVNRYIPVYMAKNDNEGIEKTINTSLFFFSVLSAILAFATLIVYKNIGSWFVIKPDLVNVASILVLIVGFCFALAMPLHLTSAILSGLQRYDIINLIAFTGLVIRVTLLVVLLSLGYGLITMGLTFGLLEIFIRITQLIFVRKFLSQISLSFRSVDFKLLREMLAYSINTLLYTLGSIIIFKASDIVIGAFMPIENVARFYVTAVLVLTLSQLLQTFTQAVKPAVSDLDARNDVARLNEVAFLSQKYMGLLLVPSICFLMVMGKDFLNIWVGNKFSPEVINQLAAVLAILALGHGLRLSQHSNFVILVGKGEHRIFGIIIASTAFASITLSVIFIKFLNMDLIGIAWSHFLPLAIISVFILPTYFNRKMGITMKQSLLQVWLPVLSGTFPTILLISLWKYLSPPNSWIQIGAIVLSSAGLTFLSSWFLSLSKLERNRLVRICVPN